MGAACGSGMWERLVGAALAAIPIPIAAKAAPTYRSHSAINKPDTFFLCRSHSRVSVQLLHQLGLTNIESAISGNVFNARSMPSHARGIVDG